MSRSSSPAESSSVLVPAEQMKSHFKEILLNLHFTPERADTLARIFTENSLDGVYSHGVNRFPRFVEYVQKGFVKKDEKSVKKSGSGALEQWDGRLAPGILNALDSTQRVMDLARQYGIGCVALSNTNHWMRGGTYGWKAAKEGFVYIGWTNTIANMPAWGAKDHKLGNNPLVMAIPFGEEAIVLDMALSQFSYGSLEAQQLNGNLMPVPAGYDREGNLSEDPSAVLESGRILPAGYWKGAGLSLLLDILSANLSGGLSTSEISQKEAEYGVSQVFIAIDISKLSNFASLQGLVNNIIKDFHASVPASEKEKIRYPGESSLKHRIKNRENGIPVNRKVWDSILSLT